MTILRRLVAATASCTLALLAAGPATAADGVDLRGYGLVTPTFTPGKAVFHCADPAHADILLGKLLADLFWDAGDDHTTHALAVGAASVTVHAWAPYGELAVARIGNDVVAVGGADDAALGAALKQGGELLRPGAVFAPAAAYPRYLDTYDLRAFKAYTHAMGSAKGLGLDSHWPFIKKFGLGGIAFQDLMVTLQCPAPGVVDYVLADYEMHTAEREGGMASIGIGCGGDLPLWIWNRMPDAIMQPSPTTLMAAWHGPGEDGSHYESWWIPQERREAGSLRFMREAMQRYRNSPALAAWHLYTGAPGGECSFHDRAGEFWDYSPTGLAAWRTWLRDDRHYDLAALGQRWYGDQAHFTNWNQVTIPDANGFFGALDADSLRLVDGWRWASAHDKDTAPAADDAAWIPFAMPPSQSQAMLPWGDSFYRVEFDAAAWAARPASWLVVSALDRSDHPTVVWLNGEQLGSEATPDCHPLAFAVAGKLKPGRNELVIRVPRRDEDQNSEGRILGPVFLTASEPKPYPFLGAQADARLVDLRDFQTAGSLNAHRRMFDTALALDPDHPLILSGDASKLLDQMAFLGATYGASLQHTGREAWYHPWFAGVGLLDGFYGTGEESGTPSTPYLSREMAWMMFDADGNHNLFWDIEDFEQEEQKTGWFTAHKREIQCFGKYLRELPKVALLRLSRGDRLGSRELWNWDLGTGELQRAHLDNAYATETELFSGAVDACPVLIDCGNDIMDDDVIAALQRYIEHGGTYVALHQTGRHTSLRADAQPLARLTGLATAAHARGALTIAKDAPLLAAFAGRGFTGDGVALAPAPAGTTVVAGPPAVAVATWADGSMAVAERTLGKGRIIQLGSHFWRDGAVESAVLAQLYADLGVARSADANDPDVWVRKATTKNGLQDWLVAVNQTDHDHRADLRLAVAEKPTAVWDLETRAVVTDATWADGWLTIPGVDFPAYSSHLYAVKRAGLVDGLGVWWAEKARYWRLPAAATSPGVQAVTRRMAKPADTSTDAIPFDHWRFHADRDGGMAAKPDWLQPGFDDAAWQALDSGAWNLADPKLADWHGTGLYRAAFTVPAGWKGRRIILHLFDWDLPIVHDKGDFLVNGTKVCSYEAHHWSQAYCYDVTDLLKEGTNELAVRVQGGQDLAGITGTVWLEPELAADKTIDLAGAWQDVAVDLHTTTDVTLPGAPNGRCLRRDVTLPADWTGRAVFLHLECPRQWLGTVAVNGHLIGINIYLHPFAPRVEINLTPYLVPGANRIELWPYRTTPSFWGPNDTAVDMPIDAIRLASPAGRAAD
jgi:hypothetical protein